MATADILKQAVFDQRIVQLPARYAVEKGALSVTSSPYNAIAASNSQHTYNINVPSQNVFVDRAVDWSSDVYVSLSVAIDAAVSGYVAAQAVLRIGQDAALCAFPLHELTQTMTATINDTSVIINTDSVLHEVLRLTDFKKNRLVRHCPTMLDRYAEYTKSDGAINSPLNGYLQATDSAEVPNGAWYAVDFTAPSGAILVGTQTPAYTSGGVAVNTVNGVPVRSAGTEPATYPLFIKFKSTEKLVLSPFIFADSHEWETGLFGINNIQLVMNMKTDVSRVLRYSTAGGRTVSAVAMNNVGANNSGFGNAKVYVQYLTPSLDLPLPSKSIVPYMEFPRYITSGSVGAGDASFQIQSQTIVLPQIPDMLLMYVKPTAYTNASYGDWYYPITAISLNFDNFAGLLSSHTAEQLYQMAVHNGLEMDFNEWIGKARNGNGGTNLTNGGQFIQTVGGMLVLRPGQDFGLQTGQAPAIIGNYTLQFNVTCQNWFANSGNYQLYVISVNSGFFETLAGSSRIIKGVLSEADIISAEPVFEMSRDGLNRLVGTGFFGKLGSMLSKAVDIYAKTKPVISGIKGTLPEGKMKDILGKVGYGMAGAGMAGAAMPAGAGKKSLSARLM
jgi:hypothetical protein